MLKQIIKAAVIGMLLIGGAKAGTSIEYDYAYDVNASRDTMYITTQVCDVVGKASRAIKVLIDGNKSDREIRASLTRAATGNLADVNGWIAYHLLMQDNMLDNLRELPNNLTYKWMGQQYPDLTPVDLYELYTSTTCEASVGNTIEVVKIIKTPKHRK